MTCSLGRRECAGARITKTARALGGFPFPPLMAIRRRRSGIEWVKADPANERVFWSQVYPKLIPLVRQGDKDNPLVQSGIIPITIVGREK